MKMMLDLLSPIELAELVDRRLAGMEADIAHADGNLDMHSDGIRGDLANVRVALSVLTEQLRAPLVSPPKREQRKT